MKINKDFTKNEIKILNKLADTHNLFIKLKEQHPADIKEWCASIHDLQKIIGMRVLRRNFPKIFYNKQNKKKRL